MWYQDTQFAHNLWTECLFFNSHAYWYQSVSLNASKLHMNTHENNAIQHVFIRCIIKYILIKYLIPSASICRAESCKDEKVQRWLVVYLYGQGCRQNVDELLYGKLKLKNPTLDFEWILAQANDGSNASRVCQWGWGQFFRQNKWVSVI